MKNTKMVSVSMCACFCVYLYFCVCGMSFINLVSLACLPKVQNVKFPKNL